MSLSGSLNDFDISYILQLIAQEGKTGKLVLSSDESELYVIFKQGKIISAGTNQQDLQSMLYKYLITVKKHPEREITRLRAIYHNNIRNLSNELLEKKYITPKELSTIIEPGLEDIACSIFLWKRGNYRFDTVSNVDLYQVGSYSVSADVITMEAARRIDELERIGKFIKKDTVFIPSKKSKYADRETDHISPLEDFPEYLYTLLDGTSSTEFLCQEYFFSEYQVYEALFELLQAKKIIPLPENISTSINAALRRFGGTADILTPKLLLSTIITVTIILSIYLIGTIVFKGVLFSNSIAERHWMKSELTRTRSNQKIAVATLHYQAKYGTLPLLLNDLFKTGILEKRDFYSFISSPTKNFNTEDISP